MMARHRICAIGWTLVCGVCGAHAAYAQTRSETIEAARTEKEQNLTPETQSKGEQIIERAEKSFPYRLMTGELNGFSVGFGNYMPGTGFAIGPQYKRADLLGGNLTLRIGTRVSSNESYGGRLDLLLPNLLSGRA